MSDNKSKYSEASLHYIETKVPLSESDRIRYEHAKAREAKFNENWKSQPVNLNEIVQLFCPVFTIKEKNEKFIFRGEQYAVQADMVAGYLKIFDLQQRIWVKTDGTPADLDTMHYKIKRREEM